MKTRFLASLAAFSLIALLAVSGGGDGSGTNDVDTPTDAPTLYEQLGSIVSTEEPYVDQRI